MNIETHELKYLLQGGGFYASDQNALEGEDAKANVSAVYAALKLAEPEFFASLAVRIDLGANERDALSKYGGVTLELATQLLFGDDLVVFNGDVKDIGFKINDLGDPGWVFRVEVASLPELAERLQQLSRSRTKPRLVGNYFEARLHRKLTVRDIIKVHSKYEHPDLTALCG